MAEQIKAIQKTPRALKTAKVAPAIANPVTTEAKPRTLSGTSYPYFDLAASIAVAEAVLNKGGGACDPDQLAAWLTYKSINSGTYLTRVSAARQFGLIEASGGRIAVTERAKAILGPVMPDDSAKAKGDAFLSVPLFAKVFERYRGGQIPPDVGLVNLFKQDFGILPDRATLAVSVFLRSAEHAGFRSEGKNRLIRPRTAANEPATNGHPTNEPSAKAEPTSHTPEKRYGGGAGGGDGTSGVHSAIVGLLRELPAPGTVWASSKKQRFLDAFKATIDFIYPEKGEAEDA